jgi:hypothetical protein
MGTINHILESKNLKDIKGSSLVRLVINIQLKLNSIANEIG